MDFSEKKVYSEKIDYLKKNVYSEKSSYSEKDLFSGKGVYCLIFENRACKFEVGKKGEFSFDAGFHIYVGSALGSGGLKRVKRHINLSRNRDRNPRWHVDYLHLNPAFRLVSAVYAFTSDRLECTLASRIGGDSVSGFGCTDCACSSHLFYRNKSPLLEVIETFEALGLSALVLEL
ncbi:GIY-YIG nuclease family protein [Methanosarcina sp.]|uniref:GIY-YIG nuclease family protein n=1 Tax=Methanosarcina sp. TaxID=2213 RepID=UPI003C70AB9C